MDNMYAIAEIVDGRPIIVETFIGPTNGEAMARYQTICAEDRDRYYHVWRIGLIMGYISDVKKEGR